MESGLPFVKRISGQSLLNLSEAGKADAITRVFNDAYRSPFSLVILDDLERLMEYVPVGPRFSNQVLQTLLVLVKALPPKGRRICIIGTTAVPEMLEQMGLSSAFQLSLHVPLLSDAAEYATVLRASSLMSDADVAVASKSMAGKTVGIKKFLVMVEMSQQAEPDTPITAERLGEAITEWNIGSS